MASRFLLKQLSLMIAMAQMGVKLSGQPHTSSTDERIMGSDSKMGRKVD